MKQSVAQDWMQTMVALNPNDSAHGPEAVTKAAFQLSLACECFESLTEAEFQDLSTRLCDAAYRFYSPFQGKACQVDDLSLADSTYVLGNLKKFDHIFRVIDNLRAEFDADWQSKIAWRNVHDYYLRLRVILLEKIKPFIS